MGLEYSMLNLLGNLEKKKQQKGGKLKIGHERPPGIMNSTVVDFRGGSYLLGDDRQPIRVAL